jgi:YYY domain-containing protein
MRRRASTLRDRMLAALGLFVLVEAVGLAALPLVAAVLGRLPGAGLGLSKIAGMLLVTWLIWVLPAVHLVGYGVPLIVVMLVLTVALGAAALRLSGRSPRTLLRGREEDGEDGPLRWRLWLGSEVVFAVAFVLGVLLASLAPDVWNTEKPMDMSFITAINASTHFPPHDPWLSGSTINYYYLGHVMLAWPIRLLAIRPDKGYLIVWGMLLALTCSSVFTFAGTFWAAARRTLARAPKGSPVAIGVLAVGTVVVLGNLAGVRSWIDAAHPPGDYPWFDPSRVIPNTINEFPSFSFILGDLHAHILALPFTVLALAFALQLAIKGPALDRPRRAVLEAVAAGLTIGALYAVNSWSAPVAAALIAAGLVVWLREEDNRRQLGPAVTWFALTIFAAVVLILPFIVNFDPEGHGVGVVPNDERRSFQHWLGDMVLIYGTLAWPIAAAFVARVVALRSRWTWIGGTATFLLFFGALLATANLTGALIEGVLLVIAVAAALSPRLPATERFFWVMVGGALALLVIPELLYLRDAFDHSALARMNTVFKAGYQAYLLLGLAAAVALPWAAAWLPKAVRRGWLAVAVVLLALGLVYPYAAIYAKTGGLANKPSLNGLKWLSAQAPGDPAAIAWLRANTSGDAVVAEAFGPDYSPNGAARISTFSGRATVLGWAGHELQWDHQVGTRESDLKTFYTTPDAQVARAIADRYGIQYVVVGPLERTTYGAAGEAKWPQLARRVFNQQGTAIWQITAPAAS